MKQYGGVDLNQAGESNRDTGGVKTDYMALFKAGRVEMWRTMSSSISHAMSHPNKQEVGV